MVTWSLSVRAPNLWFVVKNGYGNYDTNDHLTIVVKKEHKVILTSGVSGAEDNIRSEEDQRQSLTIANNLKKAWNWTECHQHTYHPYPCAYIWYLVGRCDEALHAIFESVSTRLRFVFATRTVRTFCIDLHTGCKFPDHESRSCFALRFTYDGYWHLILLLDGANANRCVTPHNCARQVQFITPTAGISRWSCVTDRDFWPFKGANSNNNRYNTENLCTTLLPEELITATSLIIPIVRWRYVKLLHGRRARVPRIPNNMSTFTWF